MTPRPLYAVAIALAALTGCSSGSGHVASLKQATTTPTASPTQTPTPTPTVMTAAEARVTYLRLVKTSNDDIKAANKVMSASSPSLAALHRIAKKARIDTHRWAISLRTTRWPADAVPVAQRYADSLAAEVLDWGSLASDAAGQANADWDKLVNDTEKSGKFAEQMREHLGLPPAK